MAETPSERDDRAGASDGGAASALIREPRQDRSRRTLNRILEAGLYLVEHEGPDALTVTEITKRARTSVGSFYARFNGKDGLLRYMGERSLNEAMVVWAQLSEGLTVGGKLRASAAEVVNRLGWLYLESAGRTVVLMDGIEDEEPTRRRRLEDRISEDVRRIAIAPHVRSDLVTRVLTGVLSDSAARLIRQGAGDPESPYPPPPGLLAELTELVVGYLGGEVQPFVTPHASPTAASAGRISEPAETLAPEEPPPPPATPPKSDIETDALVEAALAGSSFISRAPASGSPPVKPEEPPEVETHEATEPASETDLSDMPEVLLQPSVPAEPLAEDPSEATALEEAEPETVQEADLAAEPEPDEDEPAPPTEPDPFDVWG